MKDHESGGLFAPPPRPQPEVILFTDGACSGNPGPGGWAYILRHPGSGKNKEESGADLSTTNNQMELKAVIQGLKALKRPTVVKVVTDSSYVEKGLSEWMHRWKSNRWRRRTSSGYKSVKNLDLWQELDRLDQLHTIVLQRVKGHAGHPENERCDELAVAAYQELMGPSERS